MIFHFHQTIIISTVLSILTALTSAQNINSTQLCDRLCGENTVSYPFGFSDGCEIRLNCSHNSRNITIGGFIVQNVTSDQILVNLPADCDRPIEKLSQLFTTNFAPTSRNGFLLENCSSPLNNCVIPKRLVRSSFALEACHVEERNRDPFNISCYSDGIDNDSEFLTYGKVITKGNCSVLFSSVMVDLNENNSSMSGSSSIWLEFHRVELKWWINGNCDCDPNANCTRVVHGGNRHGFRCHCNEGYAGDGFAGGDGCRRVSDCNGRTAIAGGCVTSVALLIAGIIAGACIVTTVAAICYCFKKRSKSYKTKSSAKHLLSQAACTSNIPFYTYKEIERATNGFSDKQRLGTGAYGTVYSGKLHNDEFVAIKKIRYRDHDSVDQVVNEIKLLSSVSHPNLVRLLGFCIENGEQILVYEYMPNGTLSQHLQRERGSILPWTVRLTIAAETAHAIAHLHSGSTHPPIYHRDIKSSNILLDYNFNSKVADFGLSRFGMTEDSHISTAPQGTPGYVDPQYHQNFHLSDKSDVYSFGVVLVEIITAMKAVDFSRPHTEINLAALAIDRIGKGRLDEIVDPFLEPNRDAWTLSSVHRVAELAFRCLAFHRDMRPSMTEVADELEQIRLSGWAPLDESICVGSAVGSSCSSPYYGSEKSFNTSKKVGVGSKRLIIPQRIGDGLPLVEGSSPVSVHDPWLSEQSSPPSTNSLLGNLAR